MASQHADFALNQISLEYSFAELQHATRHFDPNSTLGHGSFGGVFKGVQRDGTEVAIKVLDIPEEAGFEEEVKVLSKFRHPNLVILMGFARHDSKRYLVYELLSGGDVYKRLQRSCVENHPFTWRQRVSAAFDAACGLSHLHHASPKVFHRDIKSPNILLDRNGTAKMADFGLACLSHQSEHRVKQASGTVGYACPLYVQRGVVTEGSEVYSFGIVLLELLTASPPAYLSQTADGGQHYQFLVSHIGGDSRVAAQMADPKAQWPLQVACAVADLALRCTQGSEELRPDFAEVVNLLRTLRDIPETAPVQQQQPQQYMLQAQAPAISHAQAQTPAIAPAQSPAVPSPQPVGRALQVGGGVGQAYAGPVVTTPAAGANLVMGGQVAAGACQFLQAVPGQVVVQQNPAAIAQQVPMDMPAEMYVERICNPVEGVTYVRAAEPCQSADARSRHLSYQASPAVRQQVARPVVKTPLLWTLECIHSDFVSLTGVPREQRSVVHRQEAGGPLLTTLRVGRLFQEDFFNALVPNEEARSAVSREHFQIWADETPIPGPQRTRAMSGLPCSFFLTNYSVNGTIINGTHLHTRGDQVSLHSGDLISVSRIASTEDGVQVRPFLEFRFDLTGSLLADADASEALNNTSQTSSTSPESDRPMATMAAMPAMMPSATSDQKNGASIENSYAGTSFMGTAVDPCFMLEMGGTAVRNGISPEKRRIVHGPPLGSEDNLACPPLLVGRTQQPFWEVVLIEQAFNALSRQHLRIDVCREYCAEGVVLFQVQNLSDRNPIRVCNNLEDGAVETARPLAKDECRLLQHGDVIIVNPNKGNTLWLVFLDLMAGKYATNPVSTPPIAMMPELQQRATNEAVHVGDVVKGFTNLDNTAYTTDFWNA